MALTSSQGNDFGIAGARKVSIKRTRGGSGDNKLDSSVLSIPHGCRRTYEDGLTDNGAYEDGSGGTSTPSPGFVMTVTVETLGNPPAAGTIMSFEGTECKCSESQKDANVGALASGTATFTSDFDPNATDPADC